MSQEILISIVTAYYNREDWVDETMESLLAQTHKNIEIIVVDDCSTDGTYEKLNVYRQKDSRIKLIKNIANKGFVETMRSAIELCKGEYIAIQGSGDVSFPTRIEKQMAVLKANSKVGLVGCLRNVVNKTSLDKLYAFKPDSWIEGEAFSGDASKVILKRNLFAHGSVMFKAGLYNDVGGYRSEFVFAQDRDLWIRLSKVCHFHVINESLYERYFIPGSVSINPEKRLLQRYLSELAVQCGTCELGEKDLVDRFGMQAPFFFQRSKSLSIDLSKAALRWLNQGDTNSAKVFASAALNQHANVLSVLVGFIINYLPVTFGISITGLLFKLLKMSS